MGKGSRINWETKNVIDNVTKATVLAIDQTTVACVAGAKDDHKFVNRSSNLEGSVQMRGAVSDGIKVRGQWGSFGIAYAIFIEGGTKYISGFAFLQPQTVLEYPKLAARIKANREALAGS